MWSRSFYFHSRKSHQCPRHGRKTTKLQELPAKPRYQRCHLRIRVCIGRESEWKTRLHRLFLCGVSHGNGTSVAAERTSSRARFSRFTHPSKPWAWPGELVCYYALISRRHDGMGSMDTNFLNVNFLSEFCQAFSNSRSMLLKTNISWLCSIH